MFHARAFDPLHQNLDSTRQRAQPAAHILRIEPISSPRQLPAAAVQIAIEGDSRWFEFGVALPVSHHIDGCGAGRMPNGRDSIDWPGGRVIDEC